MFYKENNFKNTELGEIPTDWKLYKLEDIVEIHDDKRVPLSEMERVNKKGRYPYCGANGVIDFIDDYTYDGEYLLLAEDGGYYGKWEESSYIMDGKFWVNNHAHVLKAKTATTNQFMRYMLNFLDLRPYLFGTTRTKLNQSVMRNISLPVPDKYEQQKITNILFNIDTTIQKTDKLITTTEKLREGLLEQLFTKGLNHKKFKKVEIRTRIYNLPEEWRISNLSETSTIKGRIGWQGLTTKEYLKEGEYLLVTGTDFENGRIAWDRCVYVSKERYIQDTNIQLKERDILITKDGTIGKIAYIDRLPKQATLNSGIFVVRPVNNAYDPSYMFWVMQSKFFNVFMNILKAGSTISHLYQRDFVNFEFPIPSLEEQQKIVEILSTVDHKLDLERKEKRYLERVKSGLMDKLLSGRVRVK